MRACIAVAALLISLVAAASSAHAVPVCQPASYVIYEALGAGGCTIGDKTFSNFDFTLLGFTGDIAVTPFLDNPNTPLIVGDIGFGLTLGLIQLGPGVKDVSLIYDVTAPGPTITDAHLGFGAGVFGDSLALVAETICPPGDTCTTPSLIVFQLGDIAQNVDSIVFDPVQSLHVRKDILVFVPPEARFPSFASITLVDQSFTQVVPEPATLLLLGAGMAGIGIFGRRRMGKTSS